MGGVVFDDAPAAGGYYEEEEEWVDPKDEDKDLQEVEDLLETYFTHIDSTFAELQALTSTSTTPKISSTSSSTRSGTSSSSSSWCSPPRRCS